MVDRSAVAKRIAQCFREAGLWNERKGRPDGVIRWAMARGVIPQDVYKWIAGDTMPNQHNLELLGREFNVNPAWLEWGDVFAPKAWPQAAKGGRGRRSLVLALVGLGLAALTPTRARAEALSVSVACPASPEAWPGLRHYVKALAALRHLRAVLARSLGRKPAPRLALGVA